MLYLAIDQRAKQITVCVRNEDGDTVLRRQVLWNTSDGVVDLGELNDTPDLGYLQVDIVCLTIR